MALTDKKIRYQTRLFFIIIIFIWILTFSFFTIQYTREREYKIETLNTKLQLINAQILGMIDGKNLTNYDFIYNSGYPSALRITIIDFAGNVKFDTENDTVYANHKNRKEIQDALKEGSGYTVRRQSKSNKYEYFYSATKGNTLIVRSAMPYTGSLSQILRIDTLYIWVILFMAISLSLIAYFATRRIGQSIKYLRDFANEAKKGNIQEYNTNTFPDDELGEISSNIVTLYKNLEEITRERDESLKNLLHEEKEKTRIKHQLTNNINHELKTPVHAIQACLETIINNKDRLDKDQIVNLAENGYQNITRLCALMHDIATITNMTDGGAQIEKMNVNINAILDNIIKDTSLLPPEKQMRINIHIPNGVKVIGNQGLIEAIFRNLVNNALAYSGGRDIFIDLIEENDEYYKFKLWDNGIGIANEHLSRLFERFYRIDDGRSRKLGGTGLGLSIVKNAVIFHGGTIYANNRHNDGLEFTFTIHK